jgi:hypothetical protein
MGDGKVYDEVTEVTAKDGEVILDGPDGVDLKMTPKAAAETGHELINGAMKATGQERMKYNPHRAK